METKEGTKEEMKEGGRGRSRELPKCWDGLHVSVKTQELVLRSPLDTTNRILQPVSGTKRRLDMSGRIEQVLSM